MNFEEMLALLVSKYRGVRKDGLAHLARTLALQCANEEEAKALLEKITDAQVTEFVKEYRKVVDEEVSKGNKTFEKNLKEKFDLVEKKTDLVIPNGDDNNPKPNDIATIVANAVAGAVKPLQDRLDKYEQGEVGKSRLQALQDKLSACKDSTFKEQTLKDFGRMNFADENAFNEYLTEKDADIKKANQSVADASLHHGAGAPMMADRTEEGISKPVADFIASQKPEANALKGKEV